LGWNLGAESVSDPPVLMLALPAVLLLRKKVVAAPTTYQSLENGTLPLLCTYIWEWLSTGGETSTLTHNAACDHFGVQGLEVLTGAASERQQLCCTLIY